MIGAGVVVLTGSRMTDRPFTYAIPPELKDRLQVGQRVEIPFGRGNRTAIGVVVSIQDADFPKEKCKPVRSILDAEPLLSEELIGIARYMVQYNLSDFTSAFSTLLPPGGAVEKAPLLCHFYRLTGDGEAAVIAKQATKQQAVREALKNGEERERRELLERTGASLSTLHAMVKKGWLVCNTERQRRVLFAQAEYARVKLSEEQQSVFQAIDGKDGSFLLCGVTGAGKTEIYLQLAESALQKGQQSIILVPEISLTPQTIQRFRGRFGDRIAVLHSRLTMAQRQEEWQRIQREEVQIVVGARSAIFAPFRNLGLIVIDEEHEDSYISEKNPKYDAREIAELRRKYHHCPVVLGSATPSVDSLYRSSCGEMIPLYLTQRIAGRQLPEIHVIDMCEELKNNNRSMFSEPLYHAIKEALKKGEQSILFLNKRGHTSFVFCRHCGYVYRCEACDVAMTYHKHNHRMVCHYCGREKEYVKKCPQCGSDQIKEFGAGTEQLEEEVCRLFPNARVYRADTDSMKRRGAYEEVYRKMANGEIDILIGTQMIAKGFDFPKVTVVGVVSADISLNFPDLRAAEKTFQLLTQVAGRAGRAELPGKVYIQTYKPDHYALQYATTHDVQGFYEKEMEMRAIREYPPYSSELHIGITGENRSKCWQACQKIKALLEQVKKNQFEELTLEGPMPAVIERIDRRYRFSILIRSKEDSHLRRLGRYLLDTVVPKGEYAISITLHPRGVL